MKINLINLLVGMVALLIFTPQVHAYSFEEDGICYNYITTDKKRTVETTYSSLSDIYGYPNEKNYIGDIKIPNEVKHKGDTYKVVRIGNNTFKGCKKLTSVTIPSSVESIGSDVWVSCDSLKALEVEEGNYIFASQDGILYTKYFDSLVSYPQGKSCDSFTIPNSVTSIGSDAFYHCRSLTSVTIPNSVTTIKSYAFRGYSSLTSVTIPNSVTSIGSEAFNSCSGLTSVTIPNSVTKIEGGVFRYCSSLTSVTIPNSVTEIGSAAFNNCSSLTSVTIPNSVKKIEYYTFSDCSSLTSVTIPNSVTTIETYAFSDCSSLTSVTIPNSVTTIKSYAFSNCSSLTSVTIPNSVKIIERSTFSGCSSLTSVTIPNSVTSIKDNVFSGCDVLRRIYCHWENPYSMAATFPYNILMEAVLYVPKGCKGAYEENKPWSQFRHIEELDYSGITETLADDVDISVTDGVLNIDNGGSETLVEVFDIVGKIVYRGYGHTVTGLCKGIYIVRVGTQTIKIRI